MDFEVVIYHSWEAKTIWEVTEKSACLTVAPQTNQECCDEIFVLFDAIVFDVVFEIVFELLV